MLDPRNGWLPKLLMTARGKLHLSLVWTFALLVLVGCSTMFKSPEDIEADKVELEISRMHFFGASGVSFTPDARRVAIGTREMIWVADIGRSESIARIGYENAARFGGNKSLQFIDNKRLAIGADGFIFIWDLKEGHVIHRLSLSSKLYSPKAIAWSEVAQLLAFSTGAGGSPVKVVKVEETGFGSVRDVPGFEGVPADLAFSHDGQYLAAAGDSKNVSVREVATGELVGDLPTEGFVTELELFGKNQLLVAGADIAFWTFKDDDDVTEIDNPSLQSQHARQVTIQVAGGIAYGLVLPFLILGGATLDDHAGAYESLVTGVNTSPQSWCGRSTTISPDGKWMADIYPGITKEVIRIFNMESGELVKSLDPKGEYHCAAKFSPDSKQLLITSNKVARMYDTDSWQHHDIRLN